MLQFFRKNKGVRGYIFLILLGLFVVAGTAEGQAPSHAYINTMRSSSITHYFVSIGVDGEFGKMVRSPSDSELEESPELADQKISQRWQGHSIRNELGVEFMKFLQFSLAQSSVNQRNSEDSTENLSGSRLSGLASLTFYSPLGNVDVGAGVQTSRLDYRQQALSADYYGSGYLYHMGYNYFMSNTVSIYLKGRQSFENLVRNSGSKDAKGMRSEMSAVGMGFRLWF